MNWTRLHLDLWNTLFFPWKLKELIKVPWLRIGERSVVRVQTGGVISRVKEHEGKAVIKHAWVSIRKMSGCRSTVSLRKCV